MGNWASHAIDKLSKGETAVINPKGNSMLPIIKSGATVTVTPVPSVELTVGSAVLVRIHGSIYLHLIKAIQGDRYQIGNNRGGINGWVNIRSIYGKATDIHNG